MYFCNEFEFLSNFYYAPITIPIITDKEVKQFTFPTVENAFQAMKDLSRCQEFQTITPAQAKRLGRQVTLRKDWETVKDDYMRRLVHAKFQQHPELAVKLKAVKGDITEENTWNDRYWGICNGIGQNKLGIILMELRDDFIKKG